MPPVLAAIVCTVRPSLASAACARSRSSGSFAKRYALPIATILSAAAFGLRDLGHVVGERDDRLLAALLEVPRRLEADDHHRDRQRVEEDEGDSGALQRWQLWRHQA